MSPLDLSGLSPNWPQTLWIVRHGESVGNVARDSAVFEGRAHIELHQRDVDVPLSSQGKRQAILVGQWIAQLAAGKLPDVIISSPHLRARETARLLNISAGMTGMHIGIDERLRERELGVLDRLTPLGVRELFPDQAEARSLNGKFHYRPPGGENWCDVILRVGGIIEALRRDNAGRRVVIVTHQVVILCLRYLLEGLTEHQILAIDAAGDVENGSVTEYRLCDLAEAPASMALVRYNSMPE